MGAQTSHFTSDIISESSLSSARSSLTYQSCSETSYADSLSTSISAREILSAPNLEGFSFNELENAITSFRFDSLLGEGGFGSSARSSLIARSSSETSYAESYSTSIFEGGKLPAPILKEFSFNELQKATRNFCPDRVLGKGEFGIVFKGWIDEKTLAATKPESGMAVAIDRQLPGRFKGHKEWLTKVEYLGQLRHPNLVKLIGNCLDDENRILVYEFMPRGSLDDHLFGGGIQSLSWEVRIKVAIGAARGLSFLHHTKSQVIYCDIKASNMLLDTEFNVKLWCRIFGHCAYRGGLTDYTGDCLCELLLDPVGKFECGARGPQSPESDVYSFGVVLLELLSGRCAGDKSEVGVEQNLVDWARPYLGDKRKLFLIMDTKLEGQYPKEGVCMVATLALQCLSDEEYRPRMTDVLATLEQLQAPKIAAKRSNKNSRKFPILSNTPH